MRLDGTSSSAPTSSVMRAATRTSPRPRTPRLPRTLWGTDRLCQRGPVIQQHMGLLFLGLSRERVQSIDGLLSAFQRYHHGSLSCALYLRDEVGKLLLKLLAVDVVIRRGGACCGGLP